MGFIHLVKPDWSLFLDRDGVINIRPVGDYVKSVEEFSFIEGVIESIALLSIHFRYIFVVTNQQGVGKKLMSSEKLNDIHQYMEDMIHQKGGRISRIYTCTDLEMKTPNCRKPSISMALLAKSDFPDVDFAKSIMIGDSDSDMEFGYKAGMYTVMVGDQKTNVKPHLRCGNMKEFTQLILETINKTNL
ncbi:MAG: HAD-IIIA family hydrolase [Bacteroidales bacterium]|nr:HAD-IIIA family hydrolase [Bacteroidales bacterium]